MAITARSDTGHHANTNTTRTATLTVTLAPYDDYELSLSVVGTGAILVDDLQIVDVATGVSVTQTGETMLVVP